MRKFEILVIGRNVDIHETVLRLINKNEDWQATGALTDEESCRLCKEKTYDMVLLGSGIEEESENKLREYFQSINPNLPIVQHYGGGSGLLYCEIMQVIDKLKATSIEK
ncbi:hypothetical protein [Arcicella lustrica]|uniref:Uncharacterized protein n=1 Tax=Arcicella lustrica TaxID=2984196 RepID=A0ABU5SG34_9BACT|nr:hypothetical protein [Arcicella sp. DC25W]MEA5426225.1 hypothetical protein [Arcicella sp. DC25W]